MGLERNLQSEALSYLNSLPDCIAENVSGNAMQSGRPDLNGCFKGRMFKLELKVADHGYKATKKQMLTLRRWKRAGCVVGVVYSMYILKQLFKMNWELSAGQYKYDKDGGSWFEIPNWGI